MFIIKTDFIREAPPIFTYGPAWDYILLPDGGRL